MPDYLPEDGCHRILKASVTGGFLDGLRLEFSDGLNCLIGGRGTGKTSVLELMSWALGHLPTDEKSSRSRSIAKLIQSNLSGGQVELEIVTQNGISYRVQRSWNSETIVLNDDGQVVDINLTNGNLFSFEVYHQNQIEDIANDPLFQLVLLDKFVSDKVKEVQSQIDTLVLDLDSNASENSKLRKDITELAEQNTQLPSVMEKLKAFKVEAGDEESKAIQSKSQSKAIRDQESRCTVQLNELLVETDQPPRTIPVSKLSFASRLCQPHHGVEAQP